MDVITYHYNRCEWGYSVYVKRAPYIIVYTDGKLQAHETFQGIPPIILKFWSRKYINICISKAEQDVHGLLWIDRLFFLSNDL